MIATIRAELVKLTRPRVVIASGILVHLSGGYIELHNRPPAFSGSDGQPYTVDVDTEPTGDPGRPHAAFLVFIRWAETGAGIMECKRALEHLRHTIDILRSQFGVLDQFMERAP